MIEPRIIEEIRIKADIVNIIGKYLPLKKRGRNFLGHCPFHNEKTPSFTVSPEKGIFRCFGCGKSGNVFSFVMEYEKLDFIGAVKQLGEQVGVEVVDDYSKKQDHEQDVLYAINDAALKFFQQQLHNPQNHLVQAYCAERKLSAEALESFGLGYAPESWDALLKALPYAPEKIALTGLVVAKDSGGGFYDRFRQRLMFPIKDVRNRVIAFSGRIILPDPDKKQAKYVNSPESAIYIKGNHLYGLHAARQAIQESGYVLLVEGQMDVVACHAAGLKNAVASLGTAFTPNQARLIQRFTKKIVIAYDKDSAGLEATDKAIEMLVSVDCTVKVLDIPAKDPDEYIQQAGVEALRYAAEHAVDYVQFKLDRIMQKYNLSDRVQKAAAAKDCVAIIDLLENSVLRDDYLTYVSKRLMVGREILHDLGKNATMQSLVRGGYVSTKHTPAPLSKYQKAEILLCKALLLFPEKRVHVLEVVSYDLFESVWQPLVKYLSGSVQAYDVLIVELDTQVTPEAALYKQLMTQILLHPEETQEAMITDYVAVVIEKGKERKRQELRDSLHVAEQAGDEDKAQMIMTQLAAF